MKDSLSTATNRQQQAAMAVVGGLTVWVAGQFGAIVNEACDRERRSGTRIEAEKMATIHLARALAATALLIYSSYYLPCRRRPLWLCWTDQSELAFPSASQTPMRETMSWGCAPQHPVGIGDALIWLAVSTTS